MTHKLNSPAARAKLKAYIEADQPKKAKMPKEIVHIIKTKADFAGWCAQFPGPAKLFGMIVRRWTGSTAFAPGRKGKWAAYTHPEWCKITGISVATLKRHLDRIEEAGLIEREVHRHGGKPTKSFLRPTPLGLTMANAKASDWERLGLSAPTADKASLGQMEDAYRKAYLASTGHPLVTISKTERAAMKAVMQELPDLAIGIVEAAIGDWIAFGQTVKSDANLADFPFKPSMLFVRKHLQSAAEFVTKKAKQAAKSGAFDPPSPFSGGHLAGKSE